MFIEYYIYYFYYSYLGLPFILRVAVLAIIIAVPIYLLLFSLFANTKREFYRRERLGKILDNKYMGKIQHILTHEYNFSIDEINNQLEIKVKKLSSRKKRLLTNKILMIRDHAKNINEHNYRLMIKYFELQEFWENKLKFGSISSKLKALRKLDDFNIEIPGAIIAPLTNNRNELLRKKARSYYMHLSKNNPFKFLDENFDETLNEWDKIEIHRILKMKSKKERLPGLVQWIKNSQNTEFRCFLIDEIKYFSQKESCPYLVDIFDTEDIKVRKHCIDTLGQLGCQVAEEKLIFIYSKQPTIIQQSIVKAIQNIYSGVALAFLEEAYLDARDDESRMIILDAIYHYGDAGRKLFKSIQKDKSDSSLLIFKHVENELLQINPYYKYNI